MRHRPAEERVTCASLRGAGSKTCIILSYPILSLPTAPPAAPARQPPGLYTSTSRLCCFLGGFPRASGWMLVPLPMWGLCSAGSFICRHGGPAPACRRRGWARIRSRPLRCAALCNLHLSTCCVRRARWARARAAAGVAGGGACGSSHTYGPERGTSAGPHAYEARALTNTH
jgi:hypothetical protein